MANLYLYSRTNEAADVQAILTTYHFVLERIAKRLAPLLPMPDASGESQRHIDQLEVVLESSGTLEEKIDGVRIAATKLQALHSRGLKPQVEDAGETLGVSSSSVSEAGAFTNLRHSRLAHPSLLGNDSGELVDWLPRAQQCALTYLSAYLGWVVRRGVATPDL